MSSSPLRRIGLGVATGVLAALTAVAPAFAAGPLPTPPGHHPAAVTDVDETVPAPQALPTAVRAKYRGRVVARPSLLLRDRPTRSSRIVGEVPYGTIVDIFCKTRGDDVDGNDRWYLLTDGTWAWGSARYIENIGAAPDWC